MMPPVSMTRKLRSSHFANPYKRSRVMPGSSPTMARLRPTTRLKSVDLPTFGRPTMTRVGTLSEFAVAEVIDFGILTGDENGGRAAFHGFMIARRFRAAHSCFHSYYRDRTRFRFVLRLPIRRFIHAPSLFRPRRHSRESAPGL